MKEKDDLKRSDHRNNFAGALQYDKAHPYGRAGKYWWIFPVLVLPIVVMGIFDKISHERARNAVNDAPFISCDRLDSICDTGRLVKTELFTDETGIKGEHGLSFAYLCLTYYIEVSRGHTSRMEWRTVSSAPQLISLFDEKRTFSVRLDERDIDIEEIPVIFEDSESQVKNSTVPDAWRKLMTVPEMRYRLRALPCGKKLQVAGTFWRRRDGIHVCPFFYKGIGKTEYLSLVSIH
jgi:hypothetical protein